MTAQMCDSPTALRERLTKNVVTSLNVYDVIEIKNEAEWNAFANDFGANPLQLWGWGELKAKHNWAATRLMIVERAGGGDRVNGDRVNGDRVNADAGAGNGDRVNAGAGAGAAKIVGGAQVLFRKLPFPFNSIAHIPRGPFVAEAELAGSAGDAGDSVNGNSVNGGANADGAGDGNNVNGGAGGAGGTGNSVNGSGGGASSRDASAKSEVLKCVAKWVKNNSKAFSLVVEPDWEITPTTDNARASNDTCTSDTTPDLQTIPWTPPFKSSADTILYPKTLILDLNLTADELLKGAKKKARQYIKKSSAVEGLEVRTASNEKDVMDCLAIYHETASRANFPLHSDEYYLDAWRCLKESSPIYICYWQGQVVAFLWLVSSNKTAFELYGGANEKGQEIRANYALKWQAILTEQKKGVTRYDFNGLLNDGISHFKRGFASHETYLIGTGKYTIKPVIDFAWTKLLP